MSQIVRGLYTDAIGIATKNLSMILFQVACCLNEEKNGEGLAAFFARYCRFSTVSCKNLISLGDESLNSIKKDHFSTILGISKSIQGIDWKEAKKDVARFLKSRELKMLDLWSQEFFLSRLQTLDGCVEYKYG